jgi:hypothetical protein
MTQPVAARPDLHLCIATGQNLANLIPTIQLAAREVWILQTPAMRASASHLYDALKARGIEVKRIDFADDDVARLHTQCERLAEALDGRPVVVNITGGTKQMTLALTDTLAPHLDTGGAPTALHFVYTDTARQRLDWLRPVATSEPMQDVLRLDDILLAQGYRQQEGSGGAEWARWQRAAEGRVRLTRFLGDNAAKLSRFFGTLNWLAQSALNEPTGPWRAAQSLDFSPGAQAAAALRLARSRGRSAVSSRSRCSSVPARSTHRISSARRNTASTCSTARGSHRSASICAAGSPSDKLVTTAPVRGARYSRRIDSKRGDVKWHSDTSSSSVTTSPATTAGGARCMPSRGTRSAGRSRSTSAGSPRPSCSRQCGN